MVSPRTKILDEGCCEILVHNFKQYSAVLWEIEGHGHEEMVALFGKVKTDSIEILHAEALPEECYEWNAEDEMGINVYSFREYCGRKAVELQSEYGEIKIIGTGHTHHRFPDASDRDICSLPNLGLGLMHLIHYAGALSPTVAKVYAPHSESARESDGYLPNLVEAASVRVVEKSLSL